MKRKQDKLSDASVAKNQLSCALEARFKRRLRSELKKIAKDDTMMEDRSHTSDEERLNSVLSGLKKTLDKVAQAVFGKHKVLDEEIQKI
ncbi:unnamed protein product [Phytophthora lilii]|uniref:Unnamed protein product n=1 Tax=Phytophthora lilii TaxID=2077276 RepID=A0A9W6TPU8_9STRA|nr:unnamed protein product [Phytophthora lilii]